MKLLQINVTANSGSTGRIAEGIGLSVQEAGHESWIAWGRYANPSRSHLIRIGRTADYLEHGIESRIFDNHGLASRFATKQLLRQIETIRPDVVHLHNIHGYFLNYPLLFDFLKQQDIPAVWTLHDCWPFTGHCAYFIASGCERWKTGCHDCPQKKTYPASYIFDRSKKNYDLKKHYFSNLERLYIVSVSRWLDRLVEESYLQNHYHTVIRNGIDTKIFSPSPERFAIRHHLHIADDETMLLGVAAVWSKRKGLSDFVELNKLLTARQKIVLIGLSDKQKAELSADVIGISHTESVEQLANLYSAADLFLNLTYEDNYPTTNLEAISCGTPCLTYQTGGSPEAVTPQTGFVVPTGDLSAVAGAIREVEKKTKESYSAVCRKHALAHFRQEDRFQEYMDLYSKIK